MPLAVGVRRRVARERDELVAQVDERHPVADPPAQLELEEAAVPGDRLVEVAHLERDVVDADEPRHHGNRSRGWNSCAGRGVVRAWRAVHRSPFRGSGGSRSARSAATPARTRNSCARTRRSHSEWPT